MDNTVSIKENLIARIKNSNDLNFLKALQTIFDSTDKELFELSDQQRESIEQGRKDIEVGNHKSHSEVMYETREWLGKL